MHLEINNAKVENYKEFICTSRHRGSQYVKVWMKCYCDQYVMGLDTQWSYKYKLNSRELFDDK